MRRVPLSMATTKQPLEVLYQGTPEIFALSATVSASDEIYPGMVMQAVSDGVALARDGAGHIGLSALYKTTLIDDEADTGNFTVWTQGRYIVYTPAFADDSENSFDMNEDGSSKYLYADANGKLEPGAAEETRKPVAILLNADADLSCIEIELLPSA